MASQGDSDIKLTPERILLDLNTRQAVMETHLTEIKEDIKEHMRRTAQNEQDIKWVKKQVFIAHGAIMVIGLLATLWKAGILPKIAG